MQGAALRSEREFRRLLEGFCDAIPVFCGFGPVIRAGGPDEGVFPGSPCI